MKPIYIYQKQSYLLQNSKTDSWFGYGTFPKTLTIFFLNPLLSVIQIRHVYDHNFITFGSKRIPGLPRKKSNPNILPPPPIVIWHLFLFILLAGKVHNGLHDAQIHVGVHNEVQHMNGRGTCVRSCAPL